MQSVKVGIVGCGAISGAYLSVSANWEILDVVAVADMLPERARARAEEYDVPRDCTVDELLSDDEIEIVINLTIPAAHYEIARASLEADKCAYSEKPMAVERSEGAALVELAQDKGLRVGGAPDTFLGAGIQTCRKLIDDGRIGEPVAATAFMMGHGHESWHPDPEFYYKKGGGPMFDMGPYYLTALVNLMGPVRRITGSTRITYPEREIVSEPKRGTIIRVDVPTHIAGIMEFANGAIGTITTSFDVWGGMTLPRIEIYGTEGSLSVPDPNTFGGPVYIKSKGDDWVEVTDLSHGNAAQSRSIGVADMAYALRLGREHRANGDLTFHVLDLMHAFHDAADAGVHHQLQSTCMQPAAVPAGLPDFELD
ncbi:MAG: Gfo/Idh/MocA family oxidoreductase [Candidatus Latescibacterota bacterium]|nr:Gfo/Idh/MocA family oxidoreductase [Candidatus Latescibacterota bacterium]